MTAYQSRVREVEAWQLTADNAQELAQMTGGQFAASSDAITGEPIIDLRIPTMGGIVRVEEGEYIIRSSAGTWHRLAAERFESEYVISEQTPSTDNPFKVGPALQHMRDFPRKV